MKECGIMPRILAHLYMAPLEDFPANHGKERNDLILNIINNQPKRVSFSWYYIPIETPEHKAILQVSTDALKIDGIRINVSAALMQSICDIYGCILPTAKICDLIYQNADIKILPCPRPISSTTKTMIAHSLDVDKQLSGKDVEGKLISTVGKNWVLNNSSLLHKIDGKPSGCNYGWHFSTPTFMNQHWEASVSLPNVRVVQGCGFFHDAYFHADYSQICRLVSRSCEINGGKMDMVDVLQNKKLANIFSHQGVLNILRVP